MVFFGRICRVRKRAPSVQDRCSYGWPAEPGQHHGPEIQYRPRPRHSQGRAASGSLQHQRAGLRQRRRRRDAERARHSLYRAQSRARAIAACTTAIVNFLGNEQPQMLLCLHEEAAVAIAHGYAKVTGKAMAAAVHSNVGLFHATMAIFNAWCDRMPILILGATGPVDAMKRRPWIDWIHTAADQGAIIRNFTKWDDQPASAGAAREVGAARLLDGEHRAVRPDLHQPRRRGAGGQAAGAAAADRRQALHAAGGAGPVGRAGQEGGRASARRQEAADPGRPHVAQGRGLEARASSSPRRSTRASPPTSRSARRSRPIIRCTSAIRRPSPPTT